MKEADELTVLPEPVQTGYYSLDGKHVSGDLKQGRLLAVSQETAVMQTSENISVFENIKIDVGDGLYAKVIRQQKDRSLLSFTGKPGCFDKWMKRILHIKDEGG